MLRVADITENLLKEYRLSPPETDSPVESSRELAARFGVSPLTADRAIRKLVDQGVFYRVGRKGTFFRSLPSADARKFLVGFAASFNSNSPHRNKRNEENLAILRRHYRVRILMHHELKDPQIGPRELAGLDALVLTGDLFDDDIRRTLSQFRKPVVTLYWDFLHGSSLNQVILELEGAFAQAVSLIRDLKKRKFILIAEGHANGRYRMECFRKALLDAGVSRDDMEEIIISNFFQQEISGIAAARQIAEDVKGKFIFCTSDFLSCAMLNSFETMDLKAGEDFEFLSCDNLLDEEAGLSTVDSHSDEIPRAMERLLKDILQAEDHYRRTVGIPATLVIRKSALSYAADKFVIEKEGEKHEN